MLYQPPPSVARGSLFLLRDVEPGAAQRVRILVAITRAVAEKGYSRVTVTDVVGLAGVSRRTFYEQFADKEGCFLAAYATGCDVLIARVVSASLAVGPDSGWQERLEAAIEAYLETLAADPEFARTFLVDILGAGPAAVDLRRRVHEQFVQQYVVLGRMAAEEEPDLEAVSEIHLRALVGGIAEVVQQHLHVDTAVTLPALAPALVQLAMAVIRG